MPLATPPSSVVAGPPVLHHSASSSRGPGLFGGRKRAEMETENAQLREWVTHMQGMDALQLAQETERLRGEISDLRHQAARVHDDLARARSQIVQTDEVALLQEVGVYEYHHPLANAIAYRDQLARIKDQIKQMARGDRAVLATTTWHVNNSATQGRAMVRDFSKLMLRAYNAEADTLVRGMKPHKLQSSIDRLDKTAHTIARLGRTMDIRISPEYHQVRIIELQLTADYLTKVEEEKERVREERERQREEQKAQREYEREKARLLKERAHYQAALAKMQAGGDANGSADLRSKLAEVDSLLADVEGREANTRAGYVYVISNIGAFGERMVKIGMTRRLDPNDRVRELGDASVPFRFDIHALIFSEDAVGLETRLHQAMADRRVNLVNLRREFFYATPTEVRDIVTNLAGEHLLEFHETPDAEEWRASNHQHDDHRTQDDSEVGAGDSRS
jgi:uncharacterized protein DUF4041/Meiotically Up-regulated Gene 113 (MUG113) protein